MLALQGLSRRYGRTVALDGLSLEVPEGEVVGFVGPNGAGKTTAMRIALGVLEADGGEVLWRGEPATREVQRGFGYMPEERGLYPKMRVDRQLRYLAVLHGRDDADAAATRWIDRLGIVERAEQRVEELSLGNQQRVQLAAALVHDPDVLILDEPFSGLDPIAVDSMVDLLREHTRDGIPVLFSSHQLDLVERLCDRLVVLANGRRVAAGTVSELRDAGVPRFRLVLGGDAGWVRDLAGLDVLDLDGTTALVEVRRDGAEQHLIAEATRRGDVHEFVRVRPALSEIYREATA